MDGESETSYDFDAPMFVDFADRGQLNLDDSDIDKWFGKLAISRLIAYS